MAPATQRTTSALLGDLLAGSPGARIHVAEAARRVQRHRSGIDQAVVALRRVEAISIAPDPAKDARGRIALFMTPEQAADWNRDAGASVAASAGFALAVSPLAAGAVAATVKKRQERAQAPLRFGVWSDGAIAIDGLMRKQLTLPAADAAGLAVTLAALPEGALAALMASPLKPSFSLQIDGRSYPLTTEQTADLVAYIEQLPARQLRKPDHRVHILRDED